MKNSLLSLGLVKSEVFKVLDEYSSNGEEHDYFSGTTADIEKRFISALNSAIRLVYLSTAKIPRKKLIRFEKPKIDAVFDDFSILPQTEEKYFDLFDISTDNTENLCICFFYSGTGILSILNSNEKVLETFELNSDYGNLVSFKMKIENPNAYWVKFSAESNRLLVKNPTFFGSDGTFSGCPNQLLPDGKHVFCDLGNDISELKGIFSEKNGFIIELPSDLFDFKDGILFCDEKYAGEYIAEFYEYPERIEENASLDTILQIPSGCIDAVVYSTAAELCAREDGELYARLSYKYREILANLYPSENLKFKNSFFSGGLFGRRRNKPNFKG